MSRFFPNDDNPKHFKALDGLRGLAVLLVLLSHASLFEVGVIPGLNFRGLGKAGVYLFFLLSAFLLDRQIACALREEKYSARYWSNYFLRRFLRIYPLFCVALLLFYGIMLVGQSTVIKTADDVVRHLCLLDGKGIFWSIPVEFKYYFASPLIMLICHWVFRWDKRLILAFLIVIAIASQVLQFYVDLPIYATTGYLVIFSTGTWLAIHEVLGSEKKSSSFTGASPADEGLNKSGLIVWDVLGFAAIGLVLISAPSFCENVLGVSIDVHKFWFFPIYSLLWAIVFIACRKGSPILKSILTLKPLRFIGVISFSAYLFHMPVVGIVKKLPIDDMFKGAIFLLITVIGSSISYLLIEKPLSRIRIPNSNPIEAE